MSSGSSTSALLQGVLLPHTPGTGALLPLTQRSCVPPPTHPCCVSFEPNLAQIALPKSQNVWGDLLPFQSHPSLCRVLPPT